MKIENEIFVFLMVRVGLACVRPVAINELIQFHGASKHPEIEVQATN